jgi:hypothetical protein
LAAFFSMAAKPEKLAALRHLLAARFPAGPRPSGRCCRTGIPAIDDLAGGLPLAAVTELVCAAPSCGSQLFVGQLLAATRATRTRVALVDSADSFDPSSFSDDLLAHLIWVRCAGAGMALGAADLLARDANIGVVMLDLRRASALELRRISGPQWYRLQRAVAPTDLALVIATPRACVASAQLRLELNVSHAATALGDERPVLAAQLSPVLQRQRLQAVSAG